MHTRFWWGKFEETDHLENLGLNERIILKSVLEIWNIKAWSGFIWLRPGKGGWVF